MSSGEERNAYLQLSQQLAVTKPNFVSFSLMVEFPATGGAIPSYQIRTVKLLRYVTYWDYFILGCEMVFCVFILYYIVEEILELRIHKFSYLTSVWNILDIVVILVKTEDPAPLRAAVPDGFFF